MHSFEEKKKKVVELYSASTRSVSNALRYSTHVTESHSFTCTLCVPSETFQQ